MNTATSPGAGTRHQTGPEPARRMPSGSVAVPSFRGDVEGLRALGILCVVAFHSGVPHLDGGYIGVDVFFVVSGFLITGILLREGGREGRISLTAFYARRARRILPAASLVLLVTALAMQVSIDPLRQYRSVLDLASAALYVANWRFINQDNDYLAADSGQSPALHYWSLSVEEQFYLVWPLLIVLCLFVGLRLGLRVRSLAAAVLGIVTLGSFVLSLHLTVADPALAYMSTLTRAWQFGVGGLLALALLRRPTTRRRASRQLRWAAGWGGLAAVALCAWSFTADTAYPGWGALGPTLGTAAIIYGGVDGAPGTASATGVFNWAPVRYVGRISYGWYLWHWPVLVVAEARWPDLELAGRLGLMGIAFLLAVGTYALFERPINTNRLLRSSTPASLAVGVVGTIVCGSVLVAVGVSRHQELSDQLATTPAARSVADVFGQQTSNSGPTTPSALTAAADVPEHPECLVDKSTVVPTSCVFGPEDGDPVVLFGDSHAQQWQSPLVSIADRLGWRLTVLTHTACSPADLRGRDLVNVVATCAEWRDQQFERIQQLRPSLVVLGSLNRYTTDESASLEAWSRTVTELSSRATRLVYLHDTPWPGDDVPSCISAHLDEWSACNLDASPPGGFDYAALEDEVVRQLKGVEEVDLDSYLCPADSCPAVSNGILLYRDTSHISDTVARVLEAPLLRKLRKLYDA